MKNTSIGTCHFVSFSKAKAYYAPYGYSAMDVKKKIDAEEISIGAPKYDAEKYSLSVNKDGQYILTDK